MVALNRDDRNALVLELLQTLNAMNQGLGINGTLIEEVACDDHKINLALDGVLGYIPKHAAEIIEALTHTVLLIAQVCIGNVYKRSSHRLSDFSFSGRGQSSGRVRLPLLLSKRQRCKSTGRAVDSCHPWR